MKIPQRQTVVNMNPSQFEKLNLEIVGTRANIFMEHFMDEMCRKLAATQLIQRFYRGHLTRMRTQREKQRNRKAQIQKQKALRVIFENIQLAVQRISSNDKKKAPFTLLKQLHYDQTLEDLIKSGSVHKVLLIQRAVRKWINEREFGLRLQVPVQFSHDFQEESQLDVNFTMPSGARKSIG